MSIDPEEGELSDKKVNKQLFRSAVITKFGRRRLSSLDEMHRIDLKSLIKAATKFIYSRMTTPALVDISGIRASIARIPQRAFDRLRRDLLVTVDEGWGESRRGKPKAELVLVLFEAFRDDPARGDELIVELTTDFERRAAAVPEPYVGDDQERDEAGQLTDAAAQEVMAESLPRFDSRDEQLYNWDSGYQIASRGPYSTLGEWKRGVDLFRQRCEAVTKNGFGEALKQEVSAWPADDVTKAFASILEDFFRGGNNQAVPEDEDTLISLCSDIVRVTMGDEADWISGSQRSRFLGDFRNEEPEETEEERQAREALEARRRAAERRQAEERVRARQQRIAELTSGRALGQQERVELERLQASQRAFERMEETRRRQGVTGQVRSREEMTQPESGGDASQGLAAEPVSQRQRSEEARDAWGRANYGAAWDGMSETEKNRRYRIRYRLRVRARRR